MSDHFYPKLVRLDATWRCNLNCLHCQTGMFRGPDHPQDLSTGECLVLFDELAGLGTQAVGFLGGEPLLRRDLGVLLRRLRKHCIQSHITTNGLLLDEARCAMYAHETGTSITVSLDGATAETHEFIRGRGTFRKAVAGLKTMLRVRGESHHVGVGISVVLHRRSVHQALEFIDLAERLGVDALTIAVVHQVGTAVRNWDDLSLTPQEVADVGVRLAERIAEHQSSTRIRINFFTPAFLDYLHRVHAITLPVTSMFDRAGLSECYIQCDGRVFPSQKCSEIIPDVLLGAAKELGVTFRDNNIRTRPFTEIWNGEDFRRYRHLMTTQRYLQHYQSCSRCPYSKTACIPNAGDALRGERDPQTICVEAHRRLDALTVPAHA